MRYNHNKLLKKSLLNSPYDPLTPLTWSEQTTVALFQNQYFPSSRRATETNCHYTASLQSTLHEVLLSNSCPFWPLLFIAALHRNICPPAILQLYIAPDCQRAFKVSTANSTWALNYLINIGWQGRLKPLCDPQAPYTDISHWMGGHNLVPFLRPLSV